MFISSTGDMRPVQLDQIESVEEHAGIMPALSDTTAQGRRTGEALQPPRQRAELDRFSLIVKAMARLPSRSRIMMVRRWRVSAAPSVVSDNAGMMPAYSSALSI